jgi:hypothetical protein
MKSKKELSEKLKKQALVIKNITVTEIPDKTGEVKEMTTIQISFEGILFNISVPAAMRLQRKLSEVLDN